MADQGHYCVSVMAVVIVIPLVRMARVSCREQNYNYHLIIATRLTISLTLIDQWWLHRYNTNCIKTTIASYLFNAFNIVMSRSQTSQKQLVSNLNNCIYRTTSPTNQRKAAPWRHPRTVRWPSRRSPLSETARYGPLRTHNMVSLSTPL